MSLARAIRPSRHLGGARKVQRDDDTIRALARIDGAEPFRRARDDELQVELVADAHRAPNVILPIGGEERGNGASDDWNERVEIRVVRRARRSADAGAIAVLQR